MSRIRVTYPTSASPASCWALMADFENIDLFNTNLKRSFMLEGSAPSGIGALRQCDLKDDKNFIRERVIDWQEGSSYTVDIYEGSMPVTHSVTTFGLAPKSDGGTLLYMEFSYRPKYGMVGALMDILMMRSMLSSMLLKVLQGLADKALSVAPSQHVSAA